MFKSKKVMISLGVFVLFALSLTLLANDEDKPIITDSSPVMSNQSLRYESIQYTDKEPEVEKIEQSINYDGYEKVAENDQLALYVEKESLGIKVENKQSGYVFESGLSPDKEYNLNTTWTNQAQSALTIDYQTADGGSDTESILSESSEVTLSLIDDGFAAVVDFAASDISLAIEVTLENDDVIVHIPNEKISENENKLVTLMAYPFLGAVENDAIPGYAVIPDGSGALMRFKDEYSGVSNHFSAAFYGEDLGFSRQKQEEAGVINETNHLSLPLYGIVHGVSQHGFLNVIESGASYANLLVYPAGVSTDFNWITARYNYRYSYFQPTNQSMEGYNTIQEDRNQFDITERISFVEGEKASYTGLAKVYQDKLIDQNIFEEKEDKFDVRLEFLGSEHKPGLIFDSVFEMTPITSIQSMVTQLESEGVADIFTIYKGWFDKGLTGALPEKFPVEDKVASDDEIEETLAFLDDKDIPMYFHTDYLKAYRNAGGYSPRQDVARKINAETINGTDEDYRYVYLSPEKSKEMLDSDLEEYEAIGIKHLAIAHASTLYSDFNDDYFTRLDHQKIWQDMLISIEQQGMKTALYKPNDYLFKATERYLDISLYSSGYFFTTDTVPFLQTVLKGYIPYYAPFSNFNANGTDDLLRMIEYGAYPSYYLTEAPSNLLINSGSKDLYTSEFSDWKDEIVMSYHLIAEALEPVQGETIMNRIVHATGLVEVEYSNGTAIIVNYNDSQMSVGNRNIASKDFIVIEGGEE
ncbi:hypothetical protein HMI01_02960 [Halolactibacillus miurensis]|uniref:Uncharacterized protein n=1 Tax=Halolactibacillus miurensis TaxID=306541 RepID=A0A1I6Q406_9BACI|nr:DUF5696 domain-containing protein [Halolactibacillus miurensis]GEM03308.1 hypothetical protein HMI01_02960 [Halolactibacillus miurensis]SFS47124.1 hypothetical protein SAMN05421668_10376 [Halolactibacillus miurensis]